MQVCDSDNTNDKPKEPERMNKRWIFSLVSPSFSIFCILFSIFFSCCSSTWFYIKGFFSFGSCWKCFMSSVYLFILFLSLFLSEKPIEKNKKGEAKIHTLLYWRTRYESEYGNKNFLAKQKKTTKYGSQLISQMRREKETRSVK